MSIPRIFVAVPIELNQTLPLPHEQSHHLTRVLRASVGDQVVLFNNEGGEFTCTITTINKKAVTLEVQKFDPIDRTPDLNIHLGLCVIKKDAMDRSLTRVTELGVKKITPVISEFTTVANRIIRDRHDHWQRVIESACEQCGMNRLPQLNQPVSLDEWLKLEPSANRYVASQYGEAVTLLNREADVTLLIGPEGGLTESETTATMKSGYQPIRLGERTLRAETAATVAVAALHQAAGIF